MSSQSVLPVVRSNILSLCIAVVLLTGGSIRVTTLSPKKNLPRKFWAVAFAFVIRESL